MQDTKNLNPRRFEFQGYNIELPDLVYFGSFFYCPALNAQQTLFW